MNFFKFSAYFQKTSIAIAVVLAATASHAQTYTYSGSFSGTFDVFPSVVFPYGTYGGFTAELQSLTDIFHYDPSTRTLEEESTFTVSPSSGSFNVYEGGPGPVFDVGSVDVTLGNNGVFTDDRTYFIPSDEPFYGSHLLSGDVVIPASGTETYNGITQTGSWDYILGGGSEFFATITPTSITINYNYLNNSGNVSAGQANGENGIEPSWAFNWDEVATVPDTGASTFTLLGASAICLGLFRQWQKAKCQRVSP